MTVLGGRAVFILLLPAVFGGGWVVGRMTNARADTGAPTRATPSPQPDPTPHCTDRRAMEANANLVGQLRDYRGRLVSAEEHVREADRARAAATDAPPARLVPPRAEWARMAREGTIRVRVPCSRLDDGPRFSTRTARRSTSSGSRRNGEQSRIRARAAGLSTEEMEALSEASDRALARTWAAMRRACEADGIFRARMRGLAGEDLTDKMRVEICGGTVLHLNDPAARAALTRVAELHAAGAGVDRTVNDAQRVADALMSASTVLYDETARVLGREKATRAIDDGVLCLDETLFDVRDSADSDED